MLLKHDMSILWRSSFVSTVISLKGDFSRYQKAPVKPTQTLPNQEQILVSETMIIVCAPFYFSLRFSSVEILRLDFFPFAVSDRRLPLLVFFALSLRIPFGLSLPPRTETNPSPVMSLVHLGKRFHSHSALSGHVSNHSLKGRIHRPVQSLDNFPYLVFG